MPHPTPAELALRQHLIASGALAPRIPAPTSEELQALRHKGYLACLDVEHAIARRQARWTANGQRKD